MKTFSTIITALVASTTPAAVSAAGLRGSSSSDTTNRELWESYNPGRYNTYDSFNSGSYYNNYNTGYNNCPRFTFRAGLPYDEVKELKKQFEQKYPGCPATMTSGAFRRNLDEIDLPDLHEIDYVDLYDLEDGSEHQDYPIYEPEEEFMVDAEIFDDDEETSADSEDADALVSYGIIEQESANEQANEGENEIPEKKFFQEPKDNAGSLSFLW